MNYYKCDLNILHLLQNHIDNLISEGVLPHTLFSKDDSWACQHLRERQAYLFCECLRATVVNALSARYLKEGGDHIFSCRTTLGRDPFRDVKAALVIGFGGFIENLCEHRDVELIMIADLQYDRMREEMEAFVKRYPGKQIQLSDGSHIDKSIRAADLVCITGSTLCNGTLEAIMAEAKGRRVILQGQSVAIHPVFLFASGAELVFTAIKTSDLLSLARDDPRGEAMRPILESSMNGVYLVRPD